MQALVGKLLDGNAQVDLTCHCAEVLIHGALVGTGEDGECQVVAVRVALRNAQLAAILNGAANQVDIEEVDLWVDALGQHTQARDDQADVIGVLAVAEETPLDTVSTGHVTQLSGGNIGAAVIMRVQR